VEIHDAYTATNDKSIHAIPSLGRSISAIDTLQSSASSLNLTRPRPALRTLISKQNHECDGPCCPRARTSRCGCRGARTGLTGSDTNEKPVVSLWTG